MKDNFIYMASTGEGFLFYEMRTTAKLMNDGCSDEEIIEKVIAENLFQFPTEKNTKKVIRACIRRLKSMNDMTLIEAIANEPSSVAKQICLYAMMTQNRLIWEFMVSVIGYKYKFKDNSFGKIDVNSYFMRLQEQNDTVAAWTEPTIKKMRSIIIKALVETEYLDNTKATELNPVYLYPVLENAIKEAGNDIILPAFNSFS